MKLVGKILRWTLVALLVLVAIVGVWIFEQKLPRKHPVTFSFVGWTNQAQGRFARFMIANTSGFPVRFAGDAQSQPRVDVMRLISDEQRGNYRHYSYSNVTSQLFVGWNQVNLDAGATFEFAFPWLEDYTNATVSLSYRPRRTLLRRIRREITTLFTGRSVERWESAPLQAPWTPEKRAFGGGMGN